MKKKLECPVCFKVAAAPLFCCPRQHLICSECRPQVRLFLITIESSILMFCPRCRSALCAETQPSQSDSGSWRRLRRNWRKWDRREFRSCPEIVLSSWVCDAYHAYITHRCQKNQLCDCTSPLAIICISFCESFKWIPYIFLSPIICILRCFALQSLHTTLLFKKSLAIWNMCIFVGLVYQNTALFSTFLRPYVCPYVMGVTSQLFLIIWWFRPQKPYISWMHIIWANDPDHSDHLDHRPFVCHGRDISTFLDNLMV